MQSYNFAQDLLDTYQSLPDFLKLVWALVPPLFVLSVLWMMTSTIRSFAPRSRGEVSRAPLPPTALTPDDPPFLPAQLEQRSLPRATNAVTGTD